MEVHLWQFLKVYFSNISFWFRLLTMSKISSADKRTLYRSVHLLVIEASVLQYAYQEVTIEEQRLEDMLRSLSQQLKQVKHNIFTAPG